ncbi:acetyl-CoA C-acetyltransferase [Panacagrimonas perspica]|uniref:propanoyl-CoA C-acyltransferase n=1 Tax=Panacagrimonas perspica TaxID=381431 RepID=A0A4R7P0I1_9GAMM|nr:thiolase family protein [Panacagrimonas perspica]TDU26928.1 acetyl-CoA C-acetyltransferase [Panacagrimonas perspica]THD03695.1 acetyl-CoA acyltransferase [Panacagrimonas perspica]
MSDRKEVVIRGVGSSHYGRFPDRRVESLAWEAILEAMQDAGAEAGEIEAVFVGSVFGPPGVATRTLRGIGIGGVPVITIEAACASGTAAYHEACEAVALGRYSCVLVFGIEHLSSLFTRGAIVPEATDSEGRAGLPLPGLYALQAQRYMAQFGTRPEAFAEVAVKNKGNGAHNPRAQLKGSAPTLDEVMSAKMIAEPLTFLQCCPVSDGSAAAVVGRPKGRRGEVRVLASAMASGQLWDHRSKEFWGEGPVRRAAQAAYAQSGIKPSEVDVLEVHDSFTIGEILTLEALDLCKVGEGASLAPSGHTQRGGQQPVNPSGGLLSRGHPLGATGTAQIAEIVWQLRGMAGAHQVPNAKLGLVETMGGGAAGMEGNASVVSLLALR